MDTFFMTLKPVPSPHLKKGQLTEAAKHGRTIFFTDPNLDCKKCHPAPLYTDLKRHNVGTRSPNEYGERFDTPTLVEVWRTAPYLHDGRYTTVKDLLVEGQHGRKGGRGGALTEQEVADLVEFVLSL